MVTFLNIPSTVVTGHGALNELSHQVQRMGGERVLLVTDQFMAQNGLAARVAQQMQSASIHVTIYSDVQPDPTVKNVLDGLEMFKTSGAQIIVALGGGSPLDAAKAISILTTNPPPLNQYMGYHKIPHPGAPLIAIPTTAGTGSEVTKVTVITDADNDVKMMMLDFHLLPTVALVDYELTMSMPPALTAHVGVDTLTHGIEAYVSRKANALTDPIALSCIKLVTHHLCEAWRNPTNSEAREAMSIAATQGGMAFSNSSVCLVHGMSRPIGALYHLPHGLSNAVLLPTVTRFSLGGALARYAAIARAMGYASLSDNDETAADALANGLEALNTQLQVPRLGECLKVSREDFERSLPKMASDALSSGSPQNNPIVPTADEIIELYRLAW